MPQITESFEGLSASANAPSLAPASPGYLAVGALGPFTFASGLQYVAPVPNGEPAIPGTLVGDFKLGNPDWGLGGNGNVSADDVPDGTAFIASRASAGGMTFVFPSPVHQFSVYATSSDYLTFTFFDAADNVIYSFNSGSSFSDFWAHQLNWFRTTGNPVSKVTITGTNIALDKLSFNTDPSVDITGTKKSDKIDGSNSVDGQPPTGLGSDWVRGRAGDDSLSGGDGTDFVYGEKGNDKLYGGSGDDYVGGGKGKDVVSGGDGHDFFILWEKLSQPFDKLKDFSPGEDDLILNAKFYKGPDEGVVSEAEFDKFFDYQGKSGTLLYDNDGKGGDAPVHIATLPKHLDLTECIFVYS